MGGRGATPAGSHFTQEEELEKKNIVATGSTVKPQSQNATRATEAKIMAKRAKMLKKTRFELARFPTRESGHEDQKV